MTDKITPLPLRACQFHGGRTGEDGLLVFCSKPAREGYSYCSDHYPRIYQRARMMTGPRVVETAVEEPAEIAPLPEVEVEAA